MDFLHYALLALDPAFWLGLLTWNVVAQSGIATFGVSAVALSQSVHRERQRWASVFGLVGQPFWFYSAVITEQWGIFALCVLYTMVWAKGFYHAWLNPPRWTQDAMVNHALAIITEDRRWMASNPVAVALTERYLSLLTDGWHTRSHEHAGHLRTRLGIEPPGTPKRRDTAVN